MDIFKKYRDYLSSLSQKDGLYEVNGEHLSHITLELSDGKRTSASAAQQSTLYARAGEQGIGSAVTQCMTEEPADLLKQAIDVGAFSSAHVEMICNSGLESYEAPQELSTVENLEELLYDLDRQLPFEGKTLTLTETVHTRWVCNQRGLARQFSRKRRELDVQYLGLSYNISSADKLNLEQLRCDLQDAEKNQLPAAHCPSGTYPAVLSNYAFTKFWVMGWQLFSAQQKGRNLGEVLASPLVNLRDLAEEEDTGYAFPFDCEGSDGKDVDLLKNGVLCGMLHNNSSGASTGNAGRTLGLVKGTDISITPKNFLFDCGEFSTEELLQKLGDGLYIFDVFDEFHGINTASGQFSFPCRAVRIEHGRRAALLEGLTINGNVFDLLKSVEAVGDHRCYMPLLMHKSWQVGAPAILVKQIAVSGN